MYRSYGPWRRFGAATVVLAALSASTACSGGSTAATSASNPVAPGAVAAPSVPPPSTVSDPAALAARAKAIAATKALHSYAFRATQRISGGARPQVTVLSGRAVRNGGVTYTLTVGGTSQQVVKVGGRTFLRRPPGRWKALAKPTPTVDPISTLLPLLQQLTRASLTGNHLSGAIPANALASGAAPGVLAPVTFILNPAHQVTSIGLHATVKAGAQSLVLDAVTAFSGFNRAPAIRAPGTIKA